MKSLLALFLLCSIPSGLAFAHTPDEEAAEIREARLAEIRERLSVFAIPSRALTVEGEGAPTVAPVPAPAEPLPAPTPTPAPPTPPVPQCKYVSSISNPAPSMKVALTFDDGPSPATTYVLETLAKYGAPAAFFQIGINAEERPELVQRVAATPGMILGNHSWTHPDFHKITPEQQAEEFNKNEILLGMLQTPKLFRYPYGNSSCETNALAHERGYQIVGWHVDSCDWAFNKTGAVTEKDAGICGVAAENRGNFRAHVRQQLLAHKGGILLMHEIQPNTIRQLDELLAELTHDGFSFIAVDDPGLKPAMR